MSDLAATSALYAARPALRLDGRAQPALAEALQGLLVEETAEGLYRCELTVGNWGGSGDGVGFTYLDRQVFDFGKQITVDAGDGEAGGRIFDGVITGLEAHYPQLEPPQLTVLAEDRLQDLRMTRRTRTFADVDDRGVFEAVASDHGLRAELDVDGPSYRLLAQLNQSDLAFLRERARVLDAEVWVEGDTLHAQARSRLNRGSLALTYGQRLRDFSVLADVAPQRTAVVVTGWDVDAKEPIRAEAGDAALGAEVGALLSGGAVLEAAFGARTEQLVHHSAPNEQEAEALAAAHARRLGRRFVSGRGTAEGDGRLRVGARVELLGLGGLFSGAYRVTAVQHTFDPGSGYQTHFSVERPGITT